MSNEKRTTTSPRELADALLDVLAEEDLRAAGARFAKLYPHFAEEIAALVADVCPVCWAASCADDCGGADDA